MKKFVALCMMVVALGFVAVGCGGAKKPTPPPAPPVTADSGDAAEASEAAPEAPEAE